MTVRPAGGRDERLRCPGHLLRLRRRGRGHRLPGRRPRSTGSPRRWALPPAWLFEAVWCRVRHHDPRGRHQRRVRRRLQRPVRRRDLRDARLLLPAAHHRPHPPRPDRPVPCRPRPRQVRARLVPRHHADGAAAGSDRPARGRDRAGHREHDGRDGDPDRAPRRGLATINIAAPGVGAILTIFLAGLAISAAAIVWFSLLIRKALLLVAIVFGPVALAGATWDATKGWFAKWATFVDRPDLLQARPRRDLPRRHRQVSAPIEADLASISDPIAGRRADVHRRVRPVHHLQVPVLRGLRHVPRDVVRAGGEVGAEPARPGAVRPAGDTAKKVLDGGTDPGSAARVVEAAGR
jgi:hypothetical protein